MEDYYIFECLPAALAEAADILSVSTGIDTKTIENIQKTREYAQFLLETIEKHPEIN